MIAVRTADAAPLSITLACTWGLCAVINLSAQSVLAGQRETSPALDEIVVTADRLDSFSADLVQVGSFRAARQLDVPLTVNVVPDALIQSQQAQSLFDALRNVPGVSPAQSPTSVFNNIAIRGINVENRSNFRLDGVLPTVNLIDLPLEDKDRVEVLKGASALYYGFTTPAGIVNLTMKRPTPAPYLVTTVFGNGFGAVGGHVDAGNTWGPIGIRLNALYGSADSGIENTRGHRSLLAAAIDYKPIEVLTLSLDAENIFKLVNEPGVYRYLRLPAPTPANLYPALLLPPLLNPSTNFGPAWASNRAEEHNVLAQTRWTLSPSWELSASYGDSHLQRDRHASTIDLNTYGPTTDGNGQLTINEQPGATFENSNYRVELAGAVRLWFTTHELLLGASQNIRDAFNSTTIVATCPGATPSAPRVACVQNVFDPVPIPDTPFPPRTGTRARINDIGYFLFDRIEMAPWFQVLAGLRKVDYTEEGLDPSVTTFHATPTPISYGFVLKPRQWLSLYGNYIEGLESTAPAPLIASNGGAMLPAAQSRQREAGLKMEPQQGFLIQAAYFDINRASAFVNGANLYVLDGRARYRGVEFNVTGEIVPDWSVYVTGQLLDARQVSGSPTMVSTDPATAIVTVVPTVVGRLIENTPRQTFSLATEYRFTNLAPGLSVNGGAYYLSQRAVNQFNQAFIPGYTLFDVGAAYSRKLNGMATTVRVYGQNLADKRYFAATGGGLIAQGPPRMVKFSAIFQF
jgi:iron complex outermembrane receptor protein